jgi:hypothetical protein
MSVKVQRFNYNDESHDAQTSLSSLSHLVSAYLSCCCTDIYYLLVQHPALTVNANTSSTSWSRSMNGKGSAENEGTAKTAENRGMPPSHYSTPLVDVMQWN